MKSLAMFPMTELSDPFSALGLPARFDLPSEIIEKAYLARSILCHPDVVGNDEEAARRSAQLNDARAILSHAESRANALLQLSGGPSKEQDRSLPPGFLAAILETREEIEEAIASKDPAQLKTWEVWAAQERDRYTSEVAALFCRSPVPVLEIRKHLNAWRYIERLIEHTGELPVV